MADDLDVEAMLEAPYKKEGWTRWQRKNGQEDQQGRDTKLQSQKTIMLKARGASPSEDDGVRTSSGDKRNEKRKKDKKRSGSRDRDRERDRKRDKGRRSRSRSRDRKDKKRIHSKSTDHHRRGRSRSPERRRGSRSKESHRNGRRRSFSKSPLRTNMEPEMTPEERDARTVFCMQLSARIRPRDLEEFFSSVGKVTDVRIITDNKTRRSKGIAYIEFESVDSVPLAIGLAGQRLLGVPIIVQASQAEKNRMANANAALQKGNSGPMRLYVGSLHFNITEDMLRGIFEPFGKIDHINLVMDNETGRSKGFGFVTFHDAEDAKKALEQLNGFELAGRPMKVGHVTERTAENQGASILDSDEMDRAGIDLGATGRLQLMAKLAEGTGFQIPQIAANALNMAPAPGQQPAAATPPIATQCFMLSNMFDPNAESHSSWDTEIRDDVIEECNKHGGVLHIYVDKASPQGNVYVKCPSISAAVASVQALHGRWFAGKVITAAYVPLPNYHALFPEAVRAQQLLMPSSHSTQALQTVGLPGLAPGMPAMGDLPIFQ